MPTTREMSKITHRNIRKWLYDPLYNTKVTSLPLCRINRIQKAKSVSTRDATYFNQQKTELINTLKNAWSVEFYTIPLYLSGLYTAPNK